MEEKIDIFLEDHARLDCLTLRYGRLFEGKFGELIGTYDEKGTDQQRQNEKAKGNEHFIGRLIHESKNVVENVRLVLRPKTPRHSRRSVVTVLPFEQSLATRAVTDLVRSLRQNGDLTPQQICDDLHPIYIEGRIANETSFFSEMIKLGIKKEVSSLTEALSDAERRAEEAETAYEASKREADKFREQIKTQDAKDPKYGGGEIEVAPICTLRTVTESKRTNRRGQTVDCTVFEFLENVPPRTMDKWADPLGKKTARARNLINEQVITTTWKPDVFSPMKWCQNIYPASDFSNLV